MDQDSNAAKKERLTDKDRDRFEELFQENLSRIRSMVREELHAKRGRDVANSNSMVVEVAIRLLRKNPNDPSLFNEALLRVIVKGVLIERIRHKNAVMRKRKGRRQSLESVIDEIADRCELPDRDRVAEQHLIDQALADLNDSELQRIAYLRFALDETHEKIANTLGMTRDVLRTRLTRIERSFEQTRKRLDGFQ